MSGSAASRAMVRDGAPVLVIGSANVDVAVATARLPRAGETVLGDSAQVGLGGKGANQAVAAALAGARVQFAARIGDDDFGRTVRAGLAARGVDITEVREIAGATTGLAAITVDAQGQNCIVVVPGANARLSPADVEALAPRIAAAALVVLQGEIPLASVAVAIDCAARAGVPVLLNPAPVGTLTLAALARGVAYLVPNETEAAQLTGLPVTTVDEALACARALVAHGVGCAIVTLGAQGCVVADASGARHHRAPAVTAVDTTGAGDAFVGCFAAALAAGLGRDAAVARALVYAALSTTARGAQASYPERAPFEAALARHGAPAHA